jgi:hypothetical protein
MFRVLGHTSTACDGLTRRDLLRSGSLALLGGLSSSAKANTKPGRAKAVILIDLFGGPSHLDTFDPKPDAPAEIRGEFGTIPSILPGIRTTEHVPLIAKQLHRTTLIRTVSHRYNSHNPYGVMTGFDGGDDKTDYYSKPTNHPSMPSVAQFLGIGRSQELPGYMMLPALPGYSQGLRRAGPYGGYLGPQYDPMFSLCEPKWSRKVTGATADFYDHTLIPMGEPELPKLDGGVTLDVLNRRKSLVEQLDESERRLDSSSKRMSDKRRAAFDILTSPKAKVAFDLSREDPKTRDRYGRDLFGNSVLLARRLVESGVTFVTVHTEAAQGSGHWDTHNNNFKLLKHVLLPFLDRSVNALIDDLTDRGLFDDVLVMIHGDMGRTPKINAAAGRDHWPQCGFCLLFGGGVKQGYVHGTSDKTAAFPKDHPVSAGDIAATFYHLIGIDPEATVPDHTGRPIPISHGGNVVNAVLA